MPLAQVWRTATDIHSDDLHLAFAQLGQFHPASTAGDVENFVRRLQGFPKMVDGIIATLELGMERKRVPPRLVIDRVVTQLRTLSDPNVEAHPLWEFAAATGRLGPRPTAARLPTGCAPPAHSGSRDPRLRPACGVRGHDLSPRLPREHRPVHTPDGKEHYAFLVRHYTTTDLTPDRIHEIGHEQLARVRTRAWNAVPVKVGFPGDLKAFLLHVRDDPSLKNRDGAGILTGTAAIVAEMANHLRELLLTGPDALGGARSTRCGPGRRHRASTCRRRPTGRRRGSSS